MHISPTTCAEPHIHVIEVDVQNIVPLLGIDTIQEPEQESGSTKELHAIQHVLGADSIV